MALAVWLELSVHGGLVSLMFGLSSLRLPVRSNGLAAKRLGIILEGPLFAVRLGEPNSMAVTQPKGSCSSKLLSSSAALAALVASWLAFKWSYFSCISCILFIISSMAVAALLLGSFDASLTV